MSSSKVNPELPSVPGIDVKELVNKHENQSCNQVLEEVQSLPPRAQQRRARNEAKGRETANDSSDTETKVTSENPDKDIQNQHETFEEGGTSLKSTGIPDEGNPEEGTPEELKVLDKALDGSQEEKIEVAGNKDAQNQDETSEGEDKPSKTTRTPEAKTPKEPKVLDKALDGSQEENIEVAGTVAANVNTNENVKVSESQVEIKLKDVGLRNHDKTETLHDSKTHKSLQDKGENQTSDIIVNSSGLEAEKNKVASDSEVKPSAEAPMKSSKDLSSVALKNKQRSEEEMTKAESQLKRIEKITEVGVDSESLRARPQKKDSSSAITQTRADKTTGEKSTNKSKVDKSAIEAAVADISGERKGTNSQPPTHFICIRIKDPKLQKGLSNAQSTIIRHGDGKNSKPLEDAKISRHQFHVTLALLRITVAQMPRLLRLLSKFKNNFTESTKSKGLQVEGVKNLNKKIVARVLDSDKTMQNLANGVRNLISDSKEFQHALRRNSEPLDPHIVLFKQKFRKGSKIFRFPKTIGEKLKNTRFGFVKCFELHLCSLQRQQRQDFYPTLWTSTNSQLVNSAKKSRPKSAPRVKTEVVQQNNTSQGESGFKKTNSRWVPKPEDVVQEHSLLKQKSPANKKSQRNMLNRTNSARSKPKSSNSEPGKKKSENKQYKKKVSSVKREPDRESNEPGPEKSNKKRNKKNKSFARDTNTESLTSSNGSNVEQKGKRNGKQAKRAFQVKKKKKIDQKPGAHEIPSSKTAASNKNRNFKSKPNVNLHIPNKNSKRKTKLSGKQNVSSGRRNDNDTKHPEQRERKDRVQMKETKKQSKQSRAKQPDSSRGDPKSSYNKSTKRFDVKGEFKSSRKVKILSTDRRGKTKSSTYGGLKSGQAAKNEGKQKSERSHQSGSPKGQKKRLPIQIEQKQRKGPHSKSRTMRDLAKQSRDREIAAASHSGQDTDTRGPRFAGMSRLSRFKQTATTVNPDQFKQAHQGNHQKGAIQLSPYIQVDGRPKVVCSGNKFYLQLTPGQVAALASGPGNQVQI